MEGNRIMRFNACIRAAFSLLLTFVFLTLPFAHAEETPAITSAVIPQDFLAPAQAVMSVTIENRSASALTDIRISADPDVRGEQYGSVEAGKSGYYEVPIDVTEKALAAGKVTAYITLKSDGKNRKYTSSAAVCRVSALPEIDFSCHIPRCAAYEGETVTAEYYIKNTGSVGISDAVVRDSAFSFVSEPFALQPGEEKFISCACPLLKDVISAPSISYLSAQSATLYVSYASANALYVAEDAVTFTVEPQSTSLTSGESARFLIKIENNGLLSYSELKLTEPSLGEIIGLTPVLYASDAVSFSLETPALTGNRQYFFSLSLRESGGSVKVFEAQPVSVSVAPAQTAAPAFAVRANNSDVTPFTFTLRTASDSALNARIIEKRLGEIKRFSRLPANSAVEFSPELTVSAGAEYVFTLEWEDAGQTQAITHAPVQALRDTPPRSEAAVSQHANYAFYAIVHASGLSDGILFGSIAFIAVLILLTVCRRIIKKRRLKRDAQETLGRTNKFAPVRPRDTEKEKTS